MAERGREGSPGPAGWAGWLAGLDGGWLRCAHQASCALLEITKEKKSDVQGSKELHSAVLICSTNITVILYLCVVVKVESSGSEGRYMLRLCGSLVHGGARVRRLCVCINELTVHTVN